MAIIRKEAYYTSNNGINKIRALIWCDDEAQAIGVVQIAHGVCEHIGRYDEFARSLVKCGFVVCGNDHLGHGKSVPSLAELGFVAEGDHVNMLRDMNTLHRIMAKRYPGVPYIMFGHSMGSFLARIYCAAFPDEIAAAVFCGTTQLPKFAAALENPVDYLLSVMPVQTAEKNIPSDIFAKLSRHALKESDDLAWISKSTENIENWRNDPMCGFPMSGALTRELVAMACKASDAGWAQKLPSDFPVLLISGAKDSVGFFGKAVIEVADALMLAGLDPQVILYPGDRHEILHEDDREKVFSDVRQFLKEVTDGTHGR